MLYSKKRARLISRSGKYIFQYFERHGLSSSAGGMFEIDPVARYVTILNGYNRYLKKGESYIDKNVTIWSTVLYSVLYAIFPGFPS